MGDCFDGIDGGEDGILLGFVVPAFVGFDVGHLVEVDDGFFVGDDEAGFTEGLNVGSCVVGLVVGKSVGVFATITVGRTD